MRTIKILFLLTELFISSMGFGMEGGAEDLSLIEAEGSHNRKNLAQESHLYKITTSEGKIFYLLGTIHILPLSALGAEFSEFIDDITTLVVETDITQAKAFIEKEFFEEIKLMKRLDDLEISRKEGELSQLTCLCLQRLVGYLLQPLVAFDGTDSQLYSKFKEKDYRIETLESIQDVREAGVKQCSSLSLESQPLEIKQRIRGSIIQTLCACPEESIICNAQRHFKKQNHFLLNCYLHNKEDFIETTKHSSNSSYIRRDEAWFSKMIELCEASESEDKILFAFGASHLYGELGLLNKFREQFGVDSVELVELYPIVKKEFSQ